MCVEQLEQQFYVEKIGGSFFCLKFVVDCLVVLVDMVQFVFGKYLKIEDGNVVVYDVYGNKLYSKVCFGEVVDFDEVLEIFVDQYFYCDQILKGFGYFGGGMFLGGKFFGSMVKLFVDCKIEVEKVVYFEMIK